MKRLRQSCCPTRHFDSASFVAALALFRVSNSASRFLKPARPRSRSKSGSLRSLGEHMANIWGHPQSLLPTKQMIQLLVHLAMRTLAGSTSDRTMASRADVEHTRMARRNRAEVVVADEIGVYHCVQRVVRRAFLCGVDPPSGNSYEHRSTRIRDRLEALAGLFGVEIAAFAVLSNGSAGSSPVSGFRCLLTSLDADRRDALPNSEINKPRTENNQASRGQTRRQRTRSGVLLVS